MGIGTVELRPAFEWICEECGRANFASTIVDQDQTAEEIEEQDGVFLLMPEIVRCPHCAAEFETVEFFSDELGEETD